MPNNTESSEKEESDVPEQKTKKQLELEAVLKAEEVARKKSEKRKR